MSSSRAVRPAAVVGSSPVRAARRARSGAAPKLLEDAPRGLQLELGAITIAKLVAGHPDEHARERGVVRGIERVEVGDGTAQRRERACGVAFGEQHRAAWPALLLPASIVSRCCRRSPRTRRPPCARQRCRAPRARRRRRRAGPPNARGRACVSCKMRRALAAAPSICPCARRSSASPGCGSRPCSPARR